MSSVIDFAIAFIGSFSSALIARRLFAMRFTPFRALVFALIYSAVAAALRRLVRRAGL